MLTSTFNPLLANALPNGASILQRSYRDSWGYWVMLCYRRNTVQPYVIWNIGEDGDAHEGIYCDSYARAQIRFNQRIHNIQA